MKAMNSILLQNFISLGRNIQFLRYPCFADPEVYVNTIGTFHDLLSLCNLPTTLAAAQSLSGITLPITPHGKIPLIAAKQLEMAVKTVVHTIEHEANGQLFVKLQSGMVSERLRQFSKEATLTTTQEHLLDETVRCIEVEAYRSAMVMGWNLVFDFIRQWVFDNELSTFQNYQQSKYPKSSQVVNYEDFFNSDKPLKEFELLQVCRGGGSDPNILKDSLVDDLEHYLRLRNNYAHSNFTSSTASMTNAYIEHLLGIANTLPFK